MNLKVNGESHTIADGGTILDLLTELGLRPEIVAVERNGQLAPRSSHAETALEEGDRIEFVTLVGGG